MNDTQRVLREARVAAEARAATKSVRSRVEKLQRKAVSIRRARELHATPITTNYAVRQADQCAMLLRVIEDFPAGTTLLVKTKSAKVGVGLEVWRLP